jgi:hypothetical protein
MRRFDHVTGARCRGEMPHDDEGSGAGQESIREPRYATQRSMLVMRG